MSPGSLIPSSGRVHKAKSQTQLWRRYKAEGRSALQGAGSVCQLIGGVWASWRHWSLSEAPTSAGSPEAAHGCSQGQGGTGWLQTPPPPLMGDVPNGRSKSFPGPPEDLQTPPREREWVGGSQRAGPFQGLQLPSQNPNASSCLLLTDFETESFTYNL